MTAADVVPRPGLLRVPEALRAALLAPEEPHRSPQADALRAAGLLEGRRLPRWLREARAAVQDPEASFEIDRGGRVGLLCRRGRLSVLLPPAIEGTGELRTLATQDGLITLCRLGAVRPRPRSEPASELRVAAPTLAQAIAAGSAAGLDLEADARRGLQAAVARSSAHWRMTARHAGDTGPPRAVEALDGDDGWWLLHPDADDRHVTLLPCDATTIVRALSGLLVPDVLVPA